MGDINERLPEEMRAVMCHAPHDYRLEKRATPRARPGELIIRITACGICTGDCKCRQGAAMFWGDDYQPAYVKPPVTPGHEFFGTVVEIGEGAADKFEVAMGDRVIAEQIIPCDKCRYCRSGQYWMCEVHNICGFQREVADGGMAEYMRIPTTARVHRIPDSISDDDAAFIEPMTCAIHAVNRGDIQLDDVVVIAGAGALGLGMVQVARLKTPRKLVVVDMVDERLELAREFGADVTVNPAREDVESVVKGLTDGYGCDVYIETTGAPVGVTQGLKVIRKLGRFVEFSVFGKSTDVDWSIIGDRKELDVRGAHLGPYCYPVAIDLFERGLITSKGVITHTYGLDDFSEGFDMADTAESIKVVLKP